MPQDLAQETEVFCLFSGASLKIFQWVVGSQRWPWLHDLSRHRMKFAVGSLITWRPLRRCGDSGKFRRDLVSKSIHLNQIITEKKCWQDGFSEKTGSIWQNGLFVFEFKRNPQLTDLKNTVQRFWFNFPPLEQLTTSKMDDFEIIFGKGLRV